MTEAIARLAAVALALLNTKKFTPLALRESLMVLRSSLQAPTELAERLLDAAHVTQASINGTLAECRRIIDSGLNLGITPIPISSDEYPATLRTIADAPPLIYVRGNSKALEFVPGVSVVGTRKATAHGIAIAERISSYLGESGLSVVSGLALGIDAAAHEGALKSTTPTIAVLAHGLEKASPRANSQLADRIVEHGGVWVSEHPYKVPAKPEFFVHRNRIQVGLSCASIIVEGEEKSGSMTQAEFCIRNRRTLFAVLPEPGGPVAIQQQLPRMLVEKRGAIPIRSKEDYSSLLDTVRLRRAELLKLAAERADVTHVP